MKKYNTIEIIGDKENNLKNISVSIPKNSLTVITGVSGSGKSSLGYNTIFAEGQRRYLDTFSSYARSFMGMMKKPDVDKISGLSPVISIDQHTISRNPRSTVGTITEIYDFIRLLFARIATAYSYITGEKMIQMTDEQIQNTIIKQYKNQEINILAPIITNRKGHYKELLELYRRKGYCFARIDGVIIELNPGLKLDRYQNHNIDLLIDTIKIASHDKMDNIRLTHSLQTAFSLGDDTLTIVSKSGKEQFFSKKLTCPTSKISYANPSPFNFSFNSPRGWCPTCHGLGFLYSENPILSDDDTLASIFHNDNWIEQIKSYIQSHDMLKFNNDETENDTDTNNLPCKKITCPTCQGKRLNKEALNFKINNKNIDEWVNMDLNNLYSYCKQITSDSNIAQLSTQQLSLAQPICKEIISRLEFMLSIGLSYLKLSLPADSLSGGESQRIRLAAQLGSNLVHVLYILDEPSIGLHQRDNQKLINSLKKLRDKNNTIIVIEHDEQIIKEADYIIDIGPKAGEQGGYVLFQGTPKQLLKTNTLTAQYLNGKKKKIINDNTSNSNNTQFLSLYGCTGNNLKNINARFPLHRLVGVSGVSGSGKSTLINQTLLPILTKRFSKTETQPLPYTKIEGIEYLNKVIAVNQSPISRNPRSTPATYTGVLTDIRELFAQLQDAKIRSWTSKHFSYNIKDGRCPECLGYGFKIIKLLFLPDIHINCESCNGTRYKNEILQIKFKNKSIADILNMTINEAVDFFNNQPIILRKIQSLKDVGLGYIKLGQPSNTLSGGENQRLKLASELARPATGKTLYILDEPTTGLHFDDIQILLTLLKKLVKLGNSVIIIEHNLDILRACDYIIDLGPEGGTNGGQIVAQGSISDIKKSDQSITAKYL